MLSDETKFNVDLDNSDQPKVENENSSNDLKNNINIKVSVESIQGSNKYLLDGTRQNTLELIKGNTYDI